MIRFLKRQFVVHPNGQIVEEHILTNEQLAPLVACVERTRTRMAQAAYAGGIPRTYFIGGGPDGE